MYISTYRLGPFFFLSLSCEMATITQLYVIVRNNMYELADTKVHTQVYKRNTNSHFQQFALARLNTATGFEWIVFFTGSVANASGEQSQSLRFVHPSEN